jgi:anti-sigma factor RsiW
MADDAKQLQEDLKELERLASKLGKSVNFNNLKNDAEAVKELLKAWKKEVDEISNEFKDLSSTFKNVLDDLKNFNSTSSSVNKSFKTLGGFADKLKYDYEDISKLSKKDLETLEKKAGIEVNNLKSRKADLDLSVKKRFQNLSDIQISSIGARTKDKNLAKEIAQYIELQSIFDENNKFKKDENNYVRKLLKLIDERLNKEKEIAANLGVMGELYNGLTSTLQKFGVNSKIIEDMGKSLEEAAGKGKVGFKQLFPIIKEGLTKALEDPLVRFTLALKAVKSGFNDIKKAFDIFLEFDKVFTETARGLGMSVDQIHNMTSAAKLSGDEFGNNAYTAGQINKAIAESNAQLGLSVDLGAATTNEFTAMTNQMGLSAEESTKIYKLGLLNNMSLKDTNKTIASSIIATQKSTGVQVNARQVLQEIGKLSAGITTKFQQNPAALAKAVTEAKALGTTLEQVDKVGESLLNFESSIENELKAELLTGKQINLEKARYAALTGDQTTLTQELANQVGSLADFQGMNVIAQKSLAEAFGLSRDEVADMLTKQETFNKLGDISDKSAQEQLAIAKERGLSETDSLMVNLKQQAAAEKLAATFDSLKVILAEMLTGPFSGFVDMMASLAKHAFLVKTAIFALATVSLAKTIGGLATMAVELGIASVGAAATAAAVTLGIGAIAIIAALSSIGSATSAATDKAKADAQNVNDGISPSSKGPFTITDSYGSTAITAKGDGLAVSPNINRESINTPMQPSFNTSAITDAISALSNTVNGLINRPQATPQFALHIDGKQLGTVVGKQQETGTAQNIYTGYRMA